MTYRIRRDGYLYSVPAAQLSDALAAAEPRLKHGAWAVAGRVPDSERYELPPGVTREPAGSLDVSELAPLFVRPVGDGLELVYSIESDLAQVEARRGVDRRVLLDALTRLVAKWRELRATQPKRVAVARFKTGKRKGELKFTRAHDEQFREAVREAIAYNEQLKSEREEIHGYLTATYAALFSAVANQGEGDSLTKLEADLALVGELLANPVRVLAAFPATLGLEQLREQLKGRAELLRVAVREGFGVGERAYLTPDPNAGPDEVNPSGPCTIERVICEGERDVWVEGVGGYSVPVSRLCKPDEAR